MTSTEIELSVGEEYHQALPGLGTAGYEWNAEVLAGSDVVSVGKELPASAVEPGAAGASVEEVFILRGLAPGRATVRFQQRRRWESGAPPQSERTMTVSVLA